MWCFFCGTTATGRGHSPVGYWAWREVGHPFNTNAEEMGGDDRRVLSRVRPSMDRPRRRRAEIDDTNRGV